MIRLIDAKGVGALVIFHVKLVILEQSAILVIYTIQEVMVTISLNKMSVKCAENSIIFIYYLN